MFKKIAAGYRNSGIMLATSLPVMAFAQETDPFMAQSTAVKAKIAEYGPELVLIGAASVIFMIGLKYVKKIKGAA